MEVLKREQPFKVPEGYFDTLHNRVMDNVRNEDKPAKPRIIRMLRPWMGIAAGFMLIIALYLTSRPEAPDLLSANNTEQNSIFDDVISDPVITLLNEYDLVCYLSDCDQMVQSTDESNENDIDLTGLTVEDIDDLILF